MKLRRAGIITKIVIAAVLVYAIVTLISLRAQIEKAEAENAELQRQIETTAAANTEKEYNLAHAEDEDVIGDIARAEYGLVLPDERVYYGD